MAEIFVALDLETTGLDPDKDSIIEIGAVRVEGERPEAIFHTFVNPGRPIPPFVRRLTGITDSDVSSAPRMEAVAGDLAAFLEGAILVGHNVLGFDAAFLRQVGVWRDGEAHDTAALARILVPDAPEYGLAALCERFAIPLAGHHRALEDARASWRLLVELRRRAETLPEGVLRQIAAWVGQTSYPWRGFFARLAEASPADWRVLGLRSGRKADVGTLAAPPRPQRVDPARACGVLASAARRADIFPEWDERPQQYEMVGLVAETIASGGLLMVEAGTGTGKSLAYLVPAACHSLGTGERVVVSTNTINLQEQLVKKDVPAVQGLLAGKGLRACTLKGRRNYLCLHRFSSLLAADSLTDLEALVASRVLVWLQTTETGDRAELRMTPEEEGVWNRFSAEGADCLTNGSAFVADGACFYQRARREAEAAHIVVVNHSLLLTDAAVGGASIPPYRHLIIDEAHHLEDEATRQFGFACGERALGELLDRCEELPQQVQRGLRGMVAAVGPGAQVAEASRVLRQAATGTRGPLKEFSARLVTFMRDHREGNEGDDRLLINRASRVQPDWPDVELAWENLRLWLHQVERALKLLAGALEAPQVAQMSNYELVMAELEAVLREIREACEGIGVAIEQDDPQRIVWLERHRSDGTPLVNWAPLNVGSSLKELLYADRDSVIFTGATLQSRGGFQHLQRRLGLEGADTAALGSPFDYERAAVVLVPKDMPEPSSPDYLQWLARAVVDLGMASRGRALVLFTSHADLRAAHGAAAGPLREAGIEALAQGPDGSPGQLVQALLSNPQTVLFGTSSFWEGVDVVGEALSLLVMARLPFTVPAEPVFQARSSEYDRPFEEYAVPQAVLRFRQGFGRLIRSKNDRGVMVVLDRRIMSKRYGAAFLEALPPCPVREVLLREMPALVAECLDGSAARA